MDNVVEFPQGVKPFNPVDCSKEEYTAYINSGTLTLGEARSTHNFLLQCFNRMSTAKSDLVSSIKTTAKDDTDTDYLNTVGAINAMYAKLQVIEDRVFEVRKLIDATEGKKLT